MGEKNERSQFREDRRAEPQIVGNRCPRFRLRPTKRFVTRPLRGEVLLSGNIKLSSGRRSLAAFLRYAKDIPTVPVARRMDLGPLLEARVRAAARPSWSALFIRAYALVCAEFAPLRRVWVSWPLPHLYEHPHTICVVAVEREWQEERIVLGSPIHQAENASLERIEEHLRHFQQADVWSISRFRLMLRFGRLPRLLQRLFLWHRLDTSGARRVKYIGTFGLTNYGKLGAESLHPIGPQTTVLTLGPIGQDGAATVKLVYDHRVLDGSDVARALARLEEVLHTTILSELRQAAQRAA